MKKLMAFSLLGLTYCFFLRTPNIATVARDEVEIRELLDRWATGFHNRDLNTVMSTYEPGTALVAYDIVPPLRYTGFDSYKKDYQEFFDQFAGSIDVEFRELTIAASPTVAYSHGIERLAGPLKNGQKFDVWVRFTQGYRKSNGRWLAVHDHISVPVDLDTGKARLDLQP